MKCRSGTFFFICLLSGFHKSPPVHTWASCLWDVIGCSRPFKYVPRSKKRWHLGIQKINKKHGIIFKLCQISSFDVECRVEMDESVKHIWNNSLISNYKMGKWFYYHSWLRKLTFYEIITTKHSLRTRLCDAVLRVIIKRCELFRPKITCYKVYRESWFHLFGTRSNLSLSSGM